MNPRYVNLGQGTASNHVIEECSELIKELCKVNRFGLMNYHPNDPEKTPNVTRVRQEIDDVKKAIRRWEKAHVDVMP